MKKMKKTGITFRRDPKNTKNKGKIKYNTTMKPHKTFCSLFCISQYLKTSRDHRPFLKKH